MKVKYKPSSDTDARRKLDPSQHGILRAQILAGEVTIRQGCKINQIRTKYWSKMDTALEAEKTNKFYKEGEIVQLLSQLVKCESCNQNFFPKNLANHQRNFPNGSCKSLKGKLLTERRV